MNGYYQWLADLVLTLHAIFVAFVVFALLLIGIGGYLQWSWIRVWWFRVTHLACILYVVVQSWFGIICPLTSLEMWLRARADEQQYEGSFIQYWVTRILFYSAPDWVFGLIYTGFGLLVVVTWFRFPPIKKSLSVGKTC